MKIVYLANARLPTEKAHGIQIVKMCEAFALAGNNVELVVPWRFNKVKMSLFDYYDVNRVFKIKKLPSLDLVPLDFILGKSAFIVQTISFLVFAKIYLFFRKYDILYTREQTAGLFFQNMTLELHRLPGRIRLFHKNIWNRAKYVIVLTNFLKKRLIASEVPENKILIAPDAVDLSKFNIEVTKEKARSAVDLPIDKNLVGYVGMLRTMGMEKGLNNLFEALKYLNQRTMLLIVGGSRDDIYFYKERAHDLDVQNRVVFIGKVSHSKVPVYLKACDVLAAPYPDSEHYRYFMSPLKIFEYMASGRPIVASDLPSIREVLNERNAILVKTGNSEALAGGIKNILENEKLAEDLSAKAFEDVQNHTWQKRAEKILDFIV